MSLAIGDGWMISRRSAGAISMYAVYSNWLQGRCVAESDDIKSTNAAERTSARGDH